MIIVLTRFRPDGIGFKYFEQTWSAIMLEAGGTALGDPPLGTFGVTVDVSDFDEDATAEQITELRRIIGQRTILEVYRRPLGSLPGNKLAYWTALRMAAELEGDPVILEDDLEFCGNAVTRMASFPIPHDLDWVSFFAPHVLPVGRMFAGLWRTPAPALATVAVKYARSSLDRLIDFANRPEFEKYRSSDQTLEECRLF